MQPGQARLALGLFTALVRHHVVYATERAAQRRTARLVTAPGVVSVATTGLERSPGIVSVVTTVLVQGRTTWCPQATVLCLAPASVKSACTSLLSPLSAPTTDIPLLMSSGTAGAGSFFVLEAARCWEDARGKPAGFPHRARQFLFHSFLRKFPPVSPQPPLLRPEEEGSFFAIFRSRACATESYSPPRC